MVFFNPIGFFNRFVDRNHDGINDRYEFGGGNPFYNGYNNRFHQGYGNFFRGRSIFGHRGEFGRFGGYHGGVHGEFGHHRGFGQHFGPRPRPVASIFNRY